MNTQHHPHDAFFVQKNMAMLGVHADQFADDYNATHQNSGRQTANLMLLDAAETVRTIPATQDDDHTLRSRAAVKAATLERIIKTQGLKAAEQYMQQSGLNCPIVPKSTRRWDDLSPIDEGKKRRLTSPRYLSRQLRNKQGRDNELRAIRLGLVNHYVSDDALMNQLTRQSINREYMAAQDAVDVDTGEFVPMADIIDSGVSNPANLRAETMTRISDAETYYTEKGYVGLFVTLTLASKYHARKKIGGVMRTNHLGVKQRVGGKSIPNPNYQNEILWTIGKGKNQRTEKRVNTPRLGQLKLVQNWSRLRAALNDKGVDFAWMRVAEPHHDATPHWHGLVFVHPDNVATFSKLVWHYWLQDEPDERGARSNRVDIVRMNPKKGRAASYIAKYISKNIDGFGIGEDFESGLDAATASDRAAAWRSLWGIRGFQFSANIGAVTKWREFRRMQEGQSGIIERARFAADTADWFGFMRINERLEQPFELIKEDADKPNTYGEVTQKLKGIRYEPDNQEVITRTRNWEIVKRGESVEVASPASVQFSALNISERLGLVENNCRENQNLPIRNKPLPPDIESRNYQLGLLRGHWKDNRPIQDKQPPPKQKYPSFAAFYLDNAGSPAPKKYRFLRVAKIISTTPGLAPTQRHYQEATA